MERARGSASGLAAGSGVPIPADVLVILVGASGSGKSSWARGCFAATQVVSSDRCRALVGDDETDQSVNRQAFAVFHEIIRRRLELGRLTVADSTGLSAFSRARMRELAIPTGAPVVAVVICTPLRALIRNNRLRERRVPREVLVRHALQLQDLVASEALEQEGYHAVHYLRFPHLPPPRIVPPVRRQE
jgi:protein phosphatase